MENAPRGIVTSGELLVGAEAGAEGVASDEAPGTWRETGGVGVGTTEVLTVTKFCGPTSGVTVVEASGPGDVRVDILSEVEAVSGVLCTVVTMIVERRTVTVCALSLAGVGEDAIDIVEAISGAADTGSLNGTVLITVVDKLSVTVPPAGTVGLDVAKTGIAVADCAEALGPNSGSTVVEGVDGVVADFAGKPGVVVGMIVVAGVGLVGED